MIKRNQLSLPHTLHDCRLPLYIWGSRCSMCIYSAVTDIVVAFRSKLVGLALKGQVS